MNFYQLRLANNKSIPSPLQLLGYKINFVWPLEEQASRLQSLLKHFFYAVNVIFFVASISAEATFISENLNDVPLLVDCFSSAFVGVQCISRVTMLCFSQRSMRGFLKRFYCEIVHTRSDEKVHYTRVRRITRFIGLVMTLFLLPASITLISFFSEIFRHELNSSSKPYFYRMSFAFYDAQAPLAYVITSIYTGWLMFSCALLLFADDYFLYLVLLNTTFRYKKLQQDLKQMLKSSRHEAQKLGHGNGDFHAIFRKRIHKVIRQQQLLDNFVAEAKSYFRYPIFCIVFFSTLLLCLLSFQFQRSTITTDRLKYIFWLICQVVHLALSGHFGQMLVDEASAMHNSFYACQWELVLPDGDVAANKSLVQDIKFAILHAEHAAYFDGMKIFPLTNGMVGLTLRSAFSYFMFLNKINDMKRFH